MVAQENSARRRAARAAIARFETVYQKELHTGMRSEASSKPRRRTSVEVSASRSTGPLACASRISPRKSGAPLSGGGWQSSSRVGKYINGVRSVAHRVVQFPVRRIIPSSPLCLAEKGGLSDFTASPRLSLSSPPRRVTPSRVDDGEANSRVQGARGHLLWRPGLWSSR